MLRIAEVRDAERIAEIYKPYVEKTGISFEESPPSADEMRGRIAHILSAYPYLVYEEKGLVLGYAYASRYRERAAYRWSLESSIYVAEDERGHGVGRSLMGALIAILREQGFVNFYAVITPPNPASFALHARFGFEPLASFPDTAFKNGAWLGVDWMQLRLNDLPERPKEPIPFPEFARSQAARLAEILKWGPEA
jgi:phosphinothricin acetyltransferase